MWFRLHGLHFLRHQNLTLASKSGNSLIHGLAPPRCPIVAPILEDNPTIFLAQVNVFYCGHSSRDVLGARQRRRPTTTLHLLHLLFIPLNLPIRLQDVVNRYGGYLVHEDGRGVQGLKY